MNNNVKTFIDKHWWKAVVVACFIVVFAQNCSGNKQNQEIKKEINEIKKKINNMNDNFEGIGENQKIINDNIVAVGKDVNSGLVALEGIKKDLDTIKSYEQDSIWPCVECNQTSQVQEPEKKQQNPVKPIKPVKSVPERKPIKDTVVAIVKNEQPQSDTVAQPKEDKVGECKVSIKKVSWSEYCRMARAGR
ncbi:MAG: hypothetical protein ACLRFI_03955 [Alphaproteobacteria bacterium]